MGEKVVAGTSTAEPPDVPHKLSRPGVGGWSGLLDEKLCSDSPTRNLNGREIRN